MSILEREREGSLPPPDTFHLAYMAHFLLGASYLVPWNAFITAIDYFQFLYPHSHIERAFSVAYMVPAMFSVCLFTAFGRNIHPKIRVNLGLALFVTTLVLVPLMDTLFIKGQRGSAPTLVVTVIAAAVNGISDPMVQGSIVGSTGELPERYMQAVMGGTAAAAVLVNVLRLVTKGLLPQDPSGLRTSANIYFIVSAVIIVLCIVSFNTVGKLPIMQYYNSVKFSSLEQTVLKDGELENESDHDMISLLREKTSSGFPVTIPSRISYMEVWKKIQGLALAMLFLYVVTLSIFPGHISEDLHSAFFKDWYPILLASCYNVFDLVGKLLPAVFLVENKIIAIGGSISRAVFYPLFYLCLHGAGFFHSDFMGIILTCLLGLSNGYWTTVLLIIAPKSVPLQEAEVVGFLMVLFLVFGLALGSVLEWVWVL